MLTRSKTPFEHADVAIVGAGNIGIAVGYYLVTHHGVRNIVLIDPRDPMSLTSAQSGENYRNWWPNRVMTEYTDHSIDLMEEIARSSGNRINMTRRGYLLATRRRQPTELLDNLVATYGERADDFIRTHGRLTRTYSPPRPHSRGWEHAPEGVDVLCDQALIRSAFPSLAPDVETALHVRRAGSISGQQLGQFMLEAIRSAGGRLIRGNVIEIEVRSPFRLAIVSPESATELSADRIVNAAGPYAGMVSAMIGEELPIKCVYQQKISFEDDLRAIPRSMPFTIDLDGQNLAWSDEERNLLAEDPSTAKLLEPMTGGIHCRPDGAEAGKWIKLGWAFNHSANDPAGEAPMNPNFPEIVVRAASRLHPRLECYARRLPRATRHYGGYYAMTPENLPLIGPAKTKDVYLAAALSGFGTMAACATGSICAAWMQDTALPGFARALSPARYEDADLVSTLANGDQGLL